MPEIDNKILMGVFGVLVVVYGHLLKHVSNAKKHFLKEEVQNDLDCLKGKVQFKDVCVEVQKTNTSEHKRIQDCLESEVRMSKERYEILNAKVDASLVKADAALLKVDAGFAEIKRMLNR